MTTTASSELVAVSAAAPAVVGDEESLAVRLARAYLLSFRGRTLDAYRVDLEQWFAWCSQHGVDPLAARRVGVDAWVRSLDQLAPATVARKVSTVRGFYAYAVEEEVLARSPVPAKGARLHLRRVPTKSQTLGPDRDEARAMLAAARRAGPLEHAVVAVLLHQGLRVSEMLGISVDDLGHQRGHRTVTVTRKGGEHQTLALAPVVVDALDLYRADMPVDPAAPPSPGLLFAELTRFGIDRLVKRVARAAGITKKLSAHSLRHACATQALDAGVSIRDLQVFLGHASPSTTQRYDLGRDQLDRSPAYALSGRFTA